MRKALTLSAIVLASSMALSVPTVAFAADAAPHPSSSSGTGPGPGPDGRKIQGTAQFTVENGTPAPVTSALNLSKDNGKPGDKIQVTIKTSPDEKSASVKSDAFGGQVDLKNDGNGVWTGTAVVSKNVKTGYYGVDAFAGGKKFDTVKFSTEATDHNTPKPKPVVPNEHKVPHGSVNTGQAPIGWVPGDAADHG